MLEKASQLPKQNKKLIIIFELHDYDNASKSKFQIQRLHGFTTEARIHIMAFAQGEISNKYVAKFVIGFVQIPN